jgi:hypothetical protein
LVEESGEEMIIGIRDTIHEKSKSIEQHVNCMHRLATALF